MRLPLAPPILQLLCVWYWTFGDTLVSVCQGWQPCPVISPVSFSRSSAGWEALGGRWWGVERKWENLAFSLPLTLYLPNSLPLFLLLSHPYFYSYSQVRAVMVNECICPFLLQYHPVTYCIFPVKRKAKSERQKGRLWSKCLAYCSAFWEK